MPASAALIAPGRSCDSDPDQPADPEEPSRLQYEPRHDGGHACRGGESGGDVSPRSHQEEEEESDRKDPEDGAREAGLGRKRADLTHDASTMPQGPPHLVEDAGEARPHPQAQ